MSDIYETSKELKRLYNNKIIELNKEYFVSEWSWNPIDDGIYTYKEIIRNVEDVDGYKVYATGSNYRHYFSWDIHDTKEECDLICDIKNQYGYDWDIKIHNGIIDRAKIEKLLR